MIVKKSSVKSLISIVNTLENKEHNMGSREDWTKEKLNELEKLMRLKEGGCAHFTEILVEFIVLNSCK